MNLEEDRIRMDKFVEKLDAAPIGQVLHDADSKRWVKEGDGLWNGGEGIRVNSLGLYAYCRKPEPPEPEVKPPKGLKEAPQGLF